MVRVIFFNVFFMRVLGWGRGEGVGGELRDMENTEDTKAVSVISVFYVLPCIQCVYRLVYSRNIFQYVSSFFLSSSSLYGGRV